MPAYVLGNRRLGDGDTKFHRLAMNAWRTPERVVVADGPDEIADVGRGRRPTADRRDGATSNASRDGSRSDASAPGSRV